MLSKIILRVAINDYFAIFIYLDISINDIFIDFLPIVYTFNNNNLTSRMQHYV